MIGLVHLNTEVMHLDSSSMTHQCDTARVRTVAVLYHDAGRGEIEVAQYHNVFGGWAASCCSGSGCWRRFGPSLQVRPLRLAASPPSLSLILYFL